MEKLQKLKPVNWGILLIIIMVMLPFFIFLRNILDYETKLIVFGIFLLIFSLTNFLIWLKLRNVLSHIMIWLCLAMALSYLLDYKGVYFIIPFAILAVVYLFFLVLDLQYRSHYKKILELAAKSVNEVKNGFTQRPFPAGKVGYSLEELKGFARFLKKNKIAFPFFEEKKILLGINEYTKFWFGKPDPKRDSFISFDMEGNVTVNIARREYKKYRDELSFDRLCDSMGELFKALLENYKKAENHKILDKLK